jgi:hypothetical protein
MPDRIAEELLSADWSPAAADILGVTNLALRAAAADILSLMHLTLREQARRSGRIGTGRQGNGEDS